MKAASFNTVALVALAAALVRAEGEPRVETIAGGQAQTAFAAEAAHTSADRPVCNRKGFLGRYAFDDEEASEAFVLQAEEEGMDVWHAEPSHVDVYHTSSVSGASSIQPIFFDAPPTSSFNDSLAYLNTSYHASYHRLSDISDLVDGLRQQAPDLVTRSIYGYSYEGRPLEVVHVRNGSAQTKSSVVVVGSQHSREWVATAAATYLLHSLTIPTNATGSLRSLLEHHDFYIIPTPNPDGYEYTWTTDRLWYKNRQPTGASRKCTGIDLARNWGYKWKRTASKPGFSSDDEKDEEGGQEEGALRRPSASDACSPGYPGVRPFEAPETSALDVFLRGLPAPGAFVELRAYGQLVSAPYAHSCKRTAKDAEDQLELASGAAHFAMKAHGTAYSVGRLCSQLFKAGGNILDYVYGVVGVKYAYTIHLRDTGTYGFSLPAEMIRPVGEETAEMVAYLARFMRDRAA